MKNNKSPDEKLNPKLLKIALIMVLGIFAPALDSTIVNVAIKTISAELHSSISIVQWVTTAYILSLGIAVPFAGWLDNRFSVKKVYITALVIFFLGSVLASLAWNIESLIVFRIVQGIGAGIMLPTLQTTLIQYSGGQKLGSLMAILGIPTLIIPILGPVLGGFLVNNLPWRVLFYVNIPICIIALLLSLKLPKIDPINSKQPLDSVGILLLSGAFIFLIFGISKMRSALGFTSMGVFIPIIAGVVCVIYFVMYSLKTKNECVIDVRLFALKSFSSSSLLLFVSGFITTGTLFILPLFFQQVRNETALAAGLMLAPQGVGMLLTRGAAGKLTDQIGARFVVMVSLIIAAIGTLPFIFATDKTTSVFLILALLVRGAGLGGFSIPIMASVYDGLAKSQISHGTIATRILQQIGGASGTAILAILFQHYISLGDSFENIINAYNRIFIVSICFTLFSIIPALFLPLKKY
ncbi:transport protein [Treponema primitia ZAS-2]|uniref:Transport protein n=1 Tax=Treponema primitia (strain ATCC BAA-887 / DSM 12427 / ZAS-2) TaxID=545694 RepID=F5YIH6_TREPZ|nr:MDR family MFS transporter [Treponema primitia]AEF85438.1 transport protein [Treponema primitia ZAS-2]